MEKLVRLINLLDSIEGKADEATKSPNEHPWLGKQVIIRTNTAGVHYGRLDFVEGKVCRLKNARRFWSWEGAFTLSELSLTGPDKPEACRFSKPVEDIRLEGIEILPCAPEGVAGIDKVKPYDYKK